MNTITISNNFMNLPVLDYSTGEKIGTLYKVLFIKNINRTIYKNILNFSYILVNLNSDDSHKKRTVIHRFNIVSWDKESIRIDSKGTILDDNRSETSLNNFVSLLGMKTISLDDKTLGIIDSIQFDYGTGEILFFNVKGGNGKLIKCNPDKIFSVNNNSVTLEIQSSEHKNIFSYLEKNDYENLNSEKAFKVNEFNSNNLNLNKVKKAEPTENVPDMHLQPFNERKKNSDETGKTNNDLQDNQSIDKGINSGLFKLDSILKKGDCCNEKIIDDVKKAQENRSNKDNLISLQKPAIEESKLSEEGEQNKRESKDNILPLMMPNSKGKEREGTINISELNHEIDSSFSTKTTVGNDIDNIGNITNINIISSNLGRIENNDVSSTELFEGSIPNQTPEYLSDTDKLRMFESNELKDNDAVETISCLESDKSSIKPADDILDNANINSNDNCAENAVDKASKEEDKINKTIDSKKNQTKSCNKIKKHKNKKIVDKKNNDSLEPCGKKIYWKNALSQIGGMVFFCIIIYLLNYFGILV